MGDRGDRGEPGDPGYPVSITALPLEGVEMVVKGRQSALDTGSAPTASIQWYKGREHPFMRPGKYHKGKP